MNQIEIAIATLECEAIDLVGELSTTQAGSCQETYITQHIEAINLAQQALREKAKREHGCDFCRDKQDGEDVYTLKAVTGGYFPAWHEMHYCFACGRKLSNIIEENDTNADDDDSDDDNHF